jgi:uncharacterized protein (TIGR02444 family)
MPEHDLPGFIPDDELPLDGPQWDFATKFYGQPGVSDACLLLQDKAGIDVSLMIFVLYAAAVKNALIDKRTIQSLDKAVANWREEIIIPLRAMRKRLKSGPNPAPGQESESVRSSIKSAELRAEQIELAVLQSKLPRIALASKIMDFRASLDAVLEYFAEKAALAPTEERGKSIEQARSALQGAIEKYVDSLGPIR